ncbi:MAG: hypothetical protein U5K32_01145 [Bacteroidales bacterium]|nr:hypothetical protein [Bacteroidales bacterium]
MNDPVFIFCSSDGHSDATLSAFSPLDNGPFDFSWYAWDEVASAFSHSLSHRMTEVMSSQLVGLPKGGYRVEISNGAGLDTAFNSLGAY